MTQSVHRALRILEALVASAPAVQLGELAKQTERTSTTNYRILQTLVTDGYAVNMKGDVTNGVPRSSPWRGR